MSDNIKPDVITSQQPTSTAGSGGRNKGFRPRGKKGGNSSSRYTAPAFKGKCEALEGSIFDTGPDQAVKFTKTKEAIEYYVGVKYSTTASEAIMHVECQREVILSGMNTLRVRETGPDAEAVRAYNNEQAKTVSKDESKYMKDMKQVYLVVVGQCTDTMI